jgi:hypothetical protein
METVNDYDKAITYAKWAEPHHILIEILIKNYINLKSIAIDYGNRNAISIFRRNLKKLSEENKNTGYLDMYYNKNSEEMKTIFKYIIDGDIDKLESKFLVENYKNIKEIFLDYNPNKEDEFMLKIQHINTFKNNNNIKVIM